MTAWASFTELSRSIQKSFKGTGLAPRTPKDAETGGVMMDKDDRFWFVANIAVTCFNIAAAAFAAYVWLGGPL